MNCALDTTTPPVYLILGYFCRQNLGDDIFENVWKYLIRTRADKNATAVFASLEDDPRKVVEKYWSQTSVLPSAIIIAGGDVLTEYFTIRIRDIVVALDETSKDNEGCAQKIPIYGVSVAAPFEGDVHLGYCDMYSKILTRPGPNTSNLQMRLGQSWVTNVQDLSCYLLNMYGTSAVKRPDNGRLAVCLAAQICGRGSHVYESNVRSIAEGLVDAYNRSKLVEIVFVPFDTSGSDSDDGRLNSDIAAVIQELDQNVNVTHAKSTNTVKDVYEQFRTGTFASVLCGRYHSHMMAVLSQTAFASVCVTRKVDFLLQELADSESDCYTYRPELDDNGVPYAYDAQKLADAIVYSVQNASAIRSVLKAYCTMVKSTGIHVLDRSIHNILHAPKLRTGATNVVNIRSVSERAEDYVRRVLSYLEKNLSVVGAVDAIADLKDRSRSIGEIMYGDASSNAPDNPELRAFLASMICSSTTNDLYPSYHYGLSEKILYAKHILDDVEFLIRDHAMSVGEKRLESCQSMSQDIINNTPKMFYCPNIDRLSQWGVHRAGWEYVLRHMWYGHAADESLPIFDDYLDSTFNWMSDVLAANDVIPYRRPWFGFVHHTATKDSGPNNVENMFKNPLFIKSLRRCRYLMAMSRNLAEDLRKRLRQCGMSHVRVHELTHPSEIPKKIFNWKDFMSNEDRMLVQIGCWYRDPYMLYTLDLPRKRWIRKAALRGRKMHNNFPPAELRINATCDDPPMNIGIVVQSKKESDADDDRLWRSPVSVRSKQRDVRDDVLMCRPDGVNNAFVFNMMGDLLKNFRSVTVLEHLDNDQYDLLMSRNVVFLHMMDAGAINTLVECVLRDTPVLINRLPAVEQVLGPEYPLYFDNGASAAQLACSPDDILKAHEYIKNKIDKTPYGIRHFIQTFNEAISSEFRIV